MTMLDYEATPAIQNSINSMGRTEDIVFSPDERFFAIAEFLDNRIRIFETSIKGEGTEQIIKITKILTITSPNIRLPHGITFLDSDHIVIANRRGDANLFQRPTESAEIAEVELTPLVTFQGRRLLGKIWTPGSVASYKLSEKKYRVFVCNNYSHSILSFVVDLSKKVRVKNNGILIKAGINIPDGISISPNKKWVAISNHGTNEVLIYRLTPTLNWLSAHLGTILNRFSSPVGRLTGVSYPHGLRFSADGTKIFVADAGEPFLNVYQSSNQDWNGHFEPTKRIKILDDETFGKEKNNPMEGGIKGLSFANGHQLLATTTQHQVLSFYSVNELLNI